jgi:nicotinamidase-related amidase
LESVYNHRDTEIQTPTSRLDSTVGHGVGERRTVTATALLVVDMLNSYRHPDADRLAPNVAEIVDPLADLITRARQRDDVELVYVNDNYGDFVADRNALTRAALEGARPDLVKPIMPTSECRFLTKVRHSAFYSTALRH